MKLYIDTSSSEKIIIGLNQKRFETDARVKKAQALLPFIVDTLQSEGLSISDIKEIDVNLGPGSFTGLRVGVAVANTLGWQLHVPVNGSLASKTNINY